MNSGIMCYRCGGREFEVRKLCHSIPYGKKTFHVVADSSNCKNCSESYLDYDQIETLLKESNLEEISKT